MVVKHSVGVGPRTRCVTCCGSAPGSRSAVAACRLNGTMLSRTPCSRASSCGACGDSGLECVATISGTFDGRSQRSEPKSLQLIVPLIASMCKSNGPKCILQEPM